MKKYIPIVILGLCVLLLLKSNFHTFNKLPLYKHSWTQLDHYSLSMGFVENDLNLFKPQTLTQNYQYPNDWQRKSFSRITNADFPIHDFIPAVFMKATGIQSPLVNQLYVYLYSLVGIFFLFRLSALFIQNKYLALFPVILLLFSPVFVYYQNGFLPSIPSFSNFIIGIYFYCLFVNKGNNKHWIWALVFITLAVLSRTSFLFLYLSVFAVEFLRLYRIRKISKAFLAGTLLSFFAIGLYYMYNVYLRKVHGSMFLTVLMSAQNMDEFRSIAKSTWEMWKYVYFSQKQYLVLIILTVFALFFRSKNTSQKIPVTVRLLALLMALSALFFFVLMEKQYVNHDYYFIDSFLFPTIFVFILFLSRIRSFKFDSLIYMALLVISIFFFRRDAKAEQEKAYLTGYWDMTTNTYNNFKNAKALLDKYKVPNNAVILCYNAYPPNLPFLLMGRTGIPVKDYNKELIQASINWKYDYMIFQNEDFIPAVYAEYPELIKHFEMIGTDGKITLCKKSAHPQETTLDAFFKFDQYTKVLQSRDHFNDTDSSWNMPVKIDQHQYGIIDTNEEFGAGYKNKSFSIQKGGNLILKFKGTLKQETVATGNLVFQLSHKGESIFYKSFETVYLLKGSNKEREIQLLLPLPQIAISGAELGIYLWNPNHGKFLYKDFEFTIYSID